jgi:hypothetical protein
VPIAGAVLDAIENALEMGQMLTAPSDSLAHIAFNVSNAKWIAVYVGLALLVGAVMARLGARSGPKKPGQISP